MRMKVLGKHNPLDEGRNVLMLITDRRRGSMWIVDICVQYGLIYASIPSLSPH